MTRAATREGRGGDGDQPPGLCRPSTSARWTTRLGLAALAALHLSLAGYVGWVVWLFTEWSAIEAGTAGAAPGGAFWVEQTGWSLAAALALGLLLYLLDRPLLTRWLDRGGRRWSAWLAAGAGALVLATGLVAGLVVVL